MISCYVIDDELHAVETLCDLILATPGLQLMGYNTNPLIALEAITNGTKPDIAFVDIHMPILSGMEFAGLAHSYTTTIFTTAHLQYAAEAYEKEIFDYLLKPITAERFLKCIARYKKQFAKNPATVTENHFYVKGNGRELTRIAIKDIVYIQSLANYIHITTTDNKKHTTHLTITELQDRLPQNSFSRVQKSYIINDDQISIINYDEVTLSDNTKVTIGDAYRAAFFAKHNKNIIKRK